MLVVFCVVRVMLQPAFLSLPATAATIAVAHSLFNIACTAILMPASGLLEKLSIAVVPDKTAKESTDSMLDERLMTTPAIAVEPLPRGGARHGKRGRRGTESLD